MSADRSFSAKVDSLVRGLIHGMSFSRACRFASVDPAIVTDAAKADPSIDQMIRDAVRASADVYLNQAEEHEVAGRYSQAIKARKEASNLTDKFRYFGDVGDLDTMGVDDVIRAIRSRGGDIPDAACDIGTTEAALNAYLTKNNLQDVLEHLSNTRSW